jgi:hypothetical protein
MSKTLKSNFWGVIPASRVGERDVHEAKAEDMTPESRQEPPRRPRTGRNNRWGRLGRGTATKVFAVGKEICLAYMEENHRARVTFVRY